MENIPKILSKEITDKYDIVGNTFINRINDEDSERLIVEVGDSKQPIFHPQVKLLKWAEKDGIENETNFSVRLIDDEPTRPTIKTEGNKIKFIKKNREAHFYDIPKSDKHKEGGFEFEVLLKTKPTTNKVQMSIETKGLKFYYQPELKDSEVQKMADREKITLLEAKRKCRPENVVGSYAVYHESKQGDYSKMGKKNYRAGKAFHIYRPKIIDSAGKEVWGKLNIDVKKKLLTVEIPQEFLDNAVYPVIVDPTFGYAGQGASKQNIENRIYMGRYSISENGTGDSLTVYLNAYGGSNYYSCKGNVYDDGDGETDMTVNLISNAETEEKEINQDNDGAITFNFNSSPSFVSGTYYRLTISTESIGLPSMTVYYDDSISGSYSYQQDISYPEWPNPTSLTGTDDRRVSIYCTYTAGGGGTEYTQTCSEVITLADILANKTSRAFAEVIAIADTLAIQKTLSRTLSEIITIVDTIKRSATKILTDTITIADSIIKSPAKVLNEAISIIDNLSIQKTLSRTLTEVISVVDTIKNKTTKIFSEVVTIVDSISISKVLYKTLSEVVTIADTIIKGTTKILSEVITIADTIAIQKVLHRTLSEIITIADTIKKTPAKIFSETIAIVDTIIKTPTKILSEAITIADTIKKQTTKILNEIVSIVDSIATQTGGTKVLYEVVTIADTIKKQTAKTLSEVISIIDSILIKKTLLRTFNEIVTIVDTLASKTAKIFSEIIIIADGITKSMSKTFSEIITITDTIKKTAIKVLTETITIIDTIIAVQSKVFTEIITIADIITKKTIKVLSELITIGDSIIRTMPHILLETITIVDTIIKSIIKRIWKKVTTMITKNNKTTMITKNNKTKL